jgi:hypothetical protein
VEIFAGACAIVTLAGTVEMPHPAHRPSKSI